MDPTSRETPLWDRCAQGRVIDLAQPLVQGMPVSPNHPGYAMALQRRHGDMVRADGGSVASELILLGGHTGTHIDALCHISHEGKLHGGVDAAAAQVGGRFTHMGVHTIPLIFCRGVMLDIPALYGVPVLAAATPITAQDLERACERQKVEIKAGDAVLIRSGWPIHWQDAESFVGLSTGTPGPDESAAAWLCERRILVTGAETIVYECTHPGRGYALLPVHRRLLVEGGIYLVEVLNLTRLAEEGISEFLFVVTPLKVVGATGVPVRPVAVVA